MAIEWNKKDSELATTEGWDLYNSEGSADGDWQVQKNDEQGLLRDDIEAWTIISNGDKPHHVKVMEFLKDKNKAEWSRLVACKKESLK